MKDSSPTFRFLVPKRAVYRCNSNVLMGFLFFYNCYFDLVKNLLLVKAVPILLTKSVQQIITRIEHFLSHTAQTSYE